MVGSAYAGVLWDLRPGLVLCKQHGRTLRFSKQMGTKCIPLANSSSDHFVCKASSYPTGGARGVKKLKSSKALAAKCSVARAGQLTKYIQVVAVVKSEATIRAM